MGKKRIYGEGVLIKNMNSEYLSSEYMIQNAPARQLAARIINHLDELRGHTTKGIRYYELEDELTALILHDFEVKAK